MALHRHPLSTSLLVCSYLVAYPVGRRHPKKPIKWVKKKYFASIEGQNWVFHGEILGQKGAFQPIRPLKAKSIAIERHVKIQSAANPYDPEWETYFEKRLDVKMAPGLLVTFSVPACCASRR